MLLATQHLPFHGHREDVIYKQTNFLELGGIFSNYSPILKEYFVKIKHVILLKGIIFVSKNHFLENRIKEKVVVGIKYIYMNYF